MSDTLPPTLAETLLIEGPDAIAFAQNQFASDVRTLVVGRWQFSAWLDAQGRVRRLFHLARLDTDRLLLVLRGGTAEAMKHELARFVFRAKLAMRADNTRFIADGAALALHHVDEGKDSIRLGCGDHALELSRHPTTGDRWRVRHVEAGWPWLPEAALDACLPPALSLHRLQAVSLEKGCYPGQEIVARLHYRGGNKRQLCRVQLSQVVASGTALADGDDTAAIALLDVVTTERDIEALAVCHRDIAAASSAVHVSQAEQTISIHCIDTWPA